MRLNRSGYCKRRERRGKKNLREKRREEITEIVFSDMTIFKTAKKTWQSVLMIDVFNNEIIAHSLTDSVGSNQSYCDCLVCFLLTSSGRKKFVGDFLFDGTKFFCKIFPVIQMEKFTPTYNLEEFKKSDFEITTTVRKTAEKLGFDKEDVHKIVSTMKREQFYKSMTSYANHKIWQDVYHVPYGDLILYVKFTQNVISEFTLLSFKEK